MRDTLYLVIPCYNEEEVLPETRRRLKQKLGDLAAAGKISENSKVVFVDDGSKDKTWELIKRFHGEDSLFTGISLSRNSGEQNAYIAGMTAANEYADMIITMDADLQDDINAIDNMIEDYYKGSDIVYGVRSSRKKESFFRKFPARVFYKIMKRLGTELIPDHSQYRLMSSRAVESLCRYAEVNMFLPALIPLMGYPSSIVYHERGGRFAGKSKYSPGKLFSLSIEAVTSFSFKPIQWLSLPAALAFAAFAVSAVALAAIKINNGVFEPWLAISASVWFLLALQLAAIRIIGEYAGKTYIETKKRPRYIIAEQLTDPD